MPVRSCSTDDGFLRHHSSVRGCWLDILVTRHTYVGMTTEMYCKVHLQRNAHLLHFKALDIHLGPQTSPNHTRGEAPRATILCLQISMLTPTRPLYHSLLPHLHSVNYSPLHISTSLFATGLLDVILSMDPFDTKGPSFVSLPQIAKGCHQNALSASVQG